MIANLFCIAIFYKKNVPPPAGVKKNIMNSFCTFIE